MDTEPICDITKKELYENRNINFTPTYKLWRDIAGLCLANGAGKNGASGGSYRGRTSKAEITPV